MKLECPVSLTKQQQEFADSETMFTLFACEFGSGKTFAAAWKGLLLSSLNKKAGVFISPTLQLAKNIMAPVFFDDILKPCGLAQETKWLKSEMKATMPWGADIYFRSGNQDLFRGHDLAWFIMDEATLIDDFERVFDMLSSRLDCKSDACFGGANCNPNLDNYETVANHFDLVIDTRDIVNEHLDAGFLA